MRPECQRPWGHFAGTWGDSPGHGRGRLRKGKPAHTPRALRGTLARSPWDCRETRDWETVLGLELLEKCSPFLGKEGQLLRGSRARQAVHQVCLPPGSHLPSPGNEHPQNCLQPPWGTVELAGSSVFSITSSPKCPNSYALHPRSC